VACRQEQQAECKLIGTLQNLCFTKKIRYESRKQLANARPRVRGQFVKINSTAVEVGPSWH
jgi:CCT motif